MNKLLLFFLLLSSRLLSFGQGGSDHDFNDYGSPNVTASRLAGTWVTNIPMSERLLNKKGLRADTVQFITDSTVLKVIPQKHFKPLKGKMLYLSGYMVMEKEKFPFLLIESDGNTRLVFFRDAGGEKYGDGESFILFIAVSDDKKNDLLCTGADFNNDPFRCWDRVK